jgi:hypothetical protein
MKGEWTFNVLRARVKQLRNLIAAASMDSVEHPVNAFERSSCPLPLAVGLLRLDICGPGRFSREFWPANPWKKRSTYNDTEIESIFGYRTGIGANLFFGDRLQ